MIEPYSKTWFNYGTFWYRVTGAYNFCEGLDP